MYDDSESETPIEDKSKPSGNIVVDIISSFIYVALVAYGSSSFIYMLHISSEEDRKIKHYNKDFKEDYHVLSGTSMFGPPYMPSSNSNLVLNMRDKDNMNKTIKKQYFRPDPLDQDKQISQKESQFYKNILAEQKEADTINSDGNFLSFKETFYKNITNDLLTNNCRRKFDQDGKKIKKTEGNDLNYNEKLHDWLYARKFFCDADNLSSGSGINAKRSENMEQATSKLATDLFNTLSELVVGKRDNTLSPNQEDYKKKISYYVPKYIFFIITGTIASVRYLMSIMLKKIYFDSNEFQYYQQKSGNNKYSRDPLNNEEAINKNFDIDKSYKVKQWRVVVLFALLGYYIYTFILTGGSYMLSSFLPFLFAIYKFNVGSLLFWNGTKSVNFVWIVIMTIFSILLFIFNFYLALIIPSVIGQVLFFVVLLIVFTTLFIYPSFDKTKIYVKLNEAKKFYGSYALDKNDIPIIDKKCEINEKNKEECLVITNKKIKQISVDTIPGNGKLSKEVDNSASESEKERHINMYQIKNDTCYKKYHLKVSGKDFILRTVKKYSSIWIGLLLHLIFKYLDKDNILKEIGGIPITLSGSPDTSTSVNIGTIPFYLSILYKYFQTY